jgi:hypothetical protein
MTDENQYEAAPNAREPLSELLRRVERDKPFAPPSRENPKKAFGDLKPRPGTVPPLPLLLLAQAMTEGADKYGAFNWRETPVDARTYRSAIERHMLLWFSGEDADPDTGIPHLASAMANCVVLLDAASAGTFIDNRPKDPNVAAYMAQMTRGSTS